MDFIILGVLVLGFLVNVLVMRSFMKRIADKINFLTNTPTDQPEETAIPVPSASLFPQAQQNSQQHDAPSPNQVSEQENDVEFNEQNLSSLPPDVKFSVEGGDSNTPPEFEEAK